MRENEMFKMIAKTETARGTRTETVRGSAKEIEAAKVRIRREARTGDTVTINVTYRTDK